LKKYSKKSSKKYSKNLRLSSLKKQKIMPYFVEKFYKFFPQLAFATAPKGGSNPLEHLPVGADLLSCTKQAVNGGKNIFLPLFCKQKSKPLTACFVHGFCKSPTEHLPRGRAVGTRPTRGISEQKR
jgi:hypothetical protein